MEWIIIGGLLVLTIFAGCKLLLRYYRKQYKKSAFANSADDHIAEVINPSRENDCYKRRCDRVYIFSLALGAMVVLVCAVGYFVSVHMDKMVEKRAAAQAQKMVAEKQADQQLPAKSVETGVKWASENGKFNWFSKSAALYRFKLAQRQDREQAEQKIQELKAKRDALNDEWQQISLRGDAKLQSVNQELYQANLKDLNAQIDKLEGPRRTVWTFETRHMSFEEWQMLYSWKNAIFAMILCCLWKFWVNYLKEDSSRLGKIVFITVVLGLLVADILLCRFIYGVYVFGVVVGAVYLIALCMTLAMPSGWFGEELRERYLNKVYDNRKLSVVIRQPATIIVLVATVLIIWGAWVLLY